MADHVADIITNAHLAGLVEQLQQSCMTLRLEIGGFDHQIAVIKELIRHPRPILILLLSGSILRVGSRRSARRSTSCEPYSRPRFRPNHPPQRQITRADLRRPSPHPSAVPP